MKKIALPCFYYLILHHFGNCGIGRLNHVQVPSPEAIQHKFARYFVSSNNNAIEYRFMLY